MAISDILKAAAGKEVTTAEITKKGGAKILAAEAMNRFREAVREALKFAGAETSREFPAELADEIVNEAHMAILKAENIRGLPGMISKGIGPTLGKQLREAGSDPMKELDLEAVEAAIRRIKAPILKGTGVISEYGKTVYPTKTRFFEVLTSHTGLPSTPELEAKLLGILPPGIVEGDTVKVTEKALKKGGILSDRLHAAVRDYYVPGRRQQVAAGQSGADAALAATQPKINPVDEALAAIPEQYRGTVQKALSDTPGRKTVRDVDKAFQGILRLEGKPGTVGESLAAQLQAKRAAEEFAARSAAATGTPEELAAFVGITPDEAKSLIAGGPRDVNEYIHTVKNKPQATVSSMLTQKVYTGKPRALLPPPDKANTILSDEADLVRAFAPVKGRTVGPDADMVSRLAGSTDEAKAAAAAAAQAAARNEGSISRMLAGAPAAPPVVPAVSRLGKWAKPLGIAGAIGGGLIADRIIGEPINEALTRKVASAYSDEDYAARPSLSARMQMLANQTYMGPNERARLMQQGVSIQQQNAAMLQQAQQAMGLAPGDSLL